MLYRILITGPDTFIGRNLIPALKAIQSGRDRVRRVEAVGNQAELKLALCDRSVSWEELEEHCRRADFVFHLAEVNRAKDMNEFMEKNFKFTERLEEVLYKCQNPCPIVFASSCHASLLGRYAGSAYGEVKQAEELLLASFGNQTKAHMAIFRFPELFGPGCPPEDASLVPALCKSIAGGAAMPKVDDGMELELVYMDDVVDALLDSLNGIEMRCRFDGPAPVPDPNGRYCYVPHSYRIAAGAVIELLERFQRLPSQALETALDPGSFTHRLYMTYLSYAR